MNDAQSTQKAKKNKPFANCATCRKSKTRCEILEHFAETDVIRCHRCKVLNIECTYSQLDRALFKAYMQPSAPGSETGATPESSASGSGHSSHNAGDTSASSHAEDPSLISQNMLSSYEYMSSNFATHPLPPFWAFLHWQNQLDWSAPFEAIQGLLKQGPTDAAVFPSHTFPDRTLRDILVQPQIDYLLELFHSRYTPWLCFDITSDGSDTEFLDLICCAVAVRHTDETNRPLISHRLQKLIEQHLVKILFSSHSGEQGIQAIKALLILSLWPSICGTSTEAGIRDGRLLIASAVSMAMNLRLNEASTRVISLQSSPLFGNEGELEEAKQRARLWNALLNVEALLCLGTGRRPLAKESPADLMVLSMISQTPTSKKDCQDLRLYLMRQLFTAVAHQESLALNSTGAEDVQVWTNSMKVIFAMIKRLHRLMDPLEVVSDYEHFYFQMGVLVLNCANLFVLYRSLHLLRRVFGEPSSADSPEPWFLNASRKGVNVLSEWGIESLRLGEAVLVSFLKADRALLATCPDAVFAFVAFAATFIVASKFLVSHKHGIEVDGSGDLLLRKTFHSFSEISFSEDHPAKRCAHLIGAVIVRWQRHKQGMDCHNPFKNRTSWNSYTARDPNACGNSAQHSESISAFEISPELLNVRMATYLSGPPNTDDCASPSHRPGTPSFHGPPSVQSEPPQQPQLIQDGGFFTFDMFQGYEAMSGYFGQAMSPGPGGNAPGSF